MSYEDRERLWRVRRAVSPLGEALYGLKRAAYVLVPLMFAAGIVGLTIWGEHAWEPYALPALVFVAAMGHYARRFVQVSRDLAAERAWLAKLPFRIENYEWILGNEESSKLIRVNLRFDFAAELDADARAALISQLTTDDSTWEYDTDNRFTGCGPREDKDLRERYRWVRGIVERMHGIPGQYRFTLVALS